MNLRPEYTVHSMEEVNKERFASLTDFLLQKSRGWVGCHSSNHVEIVANVARNTVRNSLHIYWGKVGAVWYFINCNLSLDRSVHQILEAFAFTSMQPVPYSCSRFRHIRHNRTCQGLKVLTSFEWALFDPDVHLLGHEVIGPNHEPMEVPCLVPWVHREVPTVHVLLCSCIVWSSEPWSRWQIGTRSATWNQGSPQIK